MNSLQGGHASKHPLASGPSNPYRQPFRQSGEDRHLGGFFVTGVGSIKADNAGFFYEKERLHPHKNIGNIVWYEKKKQLVIDSKQLDYMNTSSKKHQF